MRYRIRDEQFDCRYFADGAEFNTREECRKELIFYHSADHDYDELRLYSLPQLCEEFQWEIEEVT